MRMSKALLLCLCAHAAAQGTTDLFPPGYNGEALTPPMGWRSWNAFWDDIDQQTFVDAIDALTSVEWSLDGGATLFSLAGAGYARVGIDEGWEACGAGVNGTQHDADGAPVIDTRKFPDMGALVAYGHARGVAMGWYLNGCACGEQVALDLNYRGDAAALDALGFDAVKIDGCGAQTNMTRYAELFAATGKTYATENCHWGECGAFKGDADGSSCPTASWCPFNWYRTSGDINAGATSWWENLQTVARFLDADAPLSVPGCWACVARDR